MLKRLYVRLCLGKNQHSLNRSQTSHTNASIQTCHNYKCICMSLYMCIYAYICVILCGIICYHWLPSSIPPPYSTPDKLTYQHTNQLTNHPSTAILQKYSHFNKTQSINAFHSNHSISFGNSSQVDATGAAPAPAAATTSAAASVLLLKYHCHYFDFFLLILLFLFLLL